MLQVKAIDILAMLQSFLKKGQQIKRVTVFPSDYGLERMAGESRFGPQGLAVSKAEPEAIQPASRQAKANGKSRFTLSKVERAAVLEILNEQDSEDEQGRFQYLQIDCMNARLSCFHETKGFQAFLFVYQSMWKV